MRGRVLVVDDDALIRTVAERWLTRASFEVATTGSTWQARSLAATGRFDVAILDYFLGGDERGPDLIPPLRATSPAIRVVVMSGLGALPDVARHALGAGASAVVGKTKIDWPALAAGDPPPPVAARPVVDLDALRRDAIHGTLLVHGRNISRAARALGMTRSSLQRVLRKNPLPALEEDEPPEGSK
jgi:ActR/RegA family two-component response regulator